MLPIVIGIFAGAAVVTANVSQHRKPRLLDVLNGTTANGEKNLTLRLAETVAKKSPVLGAWLANVGHTLADVDDRYQCFVTHRVDPLLAGKQREQFFQALSAGREHQLTKDQKMINRQMALGVTSLGLIGFGVISGLSFTPIVLAVGAYLAFPLFRISYEILVKERRLSTLHLLTVYFTSLWLSGYYAIGTLGLLVASIAQKMMRICEDASRYELLNVFREQPRTVWALVDGIEVEIPFEQLQINDTLVIDVGHTIPVDGVIIKGFASIDQHKLTGEAQPVEKTVGDSVLASTFVLAGRIFVQVEKTGAETSAAQIGEIINRGAEYQLSMESRSIKITDQVLLPTLAITALSLPFVGMTGALAVLGSNFTVNMVWLRLLTMVNFLNASSKHKILVKDGAALERLKTIDTVVFDKTGTLTIERPHVVTIYTCNHRSDDEVLTLAAAAEHRQVHPVAQAILMAAQERHLTIPMIDDAQYEIGFGIKVKLHEQWVLVGSQRFMALEGISIPEQMRPLEITSSHLGHSLVYVGVDGALAGIIELKATTRPEAADIVNNLHKRGIKVCIISGDSEQPTKTLAQELGVDDYHANTLPEFKADLIKQLQAEGRTICFIGDGINDAIALQQADVSISLRGATTAATDTAQIVLMQADLNQFITLLDLSYALDNTISSNFKWSIIMSLLSVSSILFLHAGFLTVEVLAAIQSLQGIIIANRPLLENRQLVSSQQATLIGKLMAP